MIRKDITKIAERLDLLGHPEAFVVVDHVLLGLRLVFFRILALPQIAL